MVNKKWLTGTELLSMQYFIPMTCKFNLLETLGAGKSIFPSIS